jgi:hypothetical protein
MLLAFRVGTIASRTDAEVDPHNVGRVPEAVKIAAPVPRARAPDRRRVRGIHPG